MNTATKQLEKKQKKKHKNQHEKKHEKKTIINFLLVDEDIEWMEDFHSKFDIQKEEVIKGKKIGLSLLKLNTDPNISITEDGIIKNPGEACLSLLQSDLGIYCQGVLLDWELQSKLEKKELIRAIKKLRPELPIYILTQYCNGYEIVEGVSDLIDDYFSKLTAEADMKGMIHRLISHFNTRRKSPFWEAYRDYIVDSKDAWHTPGHFSGRSFMISDYINDFYYFFGKNTFAGDLSISVDNLGSLLDGTGHIKEAQRKAAHTFGAKHTFFVTNGSSTSNKIIIQTLLRKGDEVLVDRNCHKSVHYGIIQNGAVPVYLESEYDKELGIFAPPRFEDIQREIESGRHQFKLLILTGCTYDGILSDIRSIVSLAHQHEIKVFIDEAWFAYAGFHPAYNRFSAVYAGADYVTHSSHKVLSSFSQASMIHVNDPAFDEDFFREIFYIYTSTSPQYQMIASLDVASTQMLMEGFRLVQQARHYADQFRTKVKESLDYFRLVEEEGFRQAFPHLENEKVGYDPLKVLIDFSKTGMSRDEILGEIKSKAMLEIEKSTHSTFLVLFTIGTSDQKAVRLFKVLKEIESKPHKTPRPLNHSLVDIPSEIKLTDGLTPSEVFYGKRKRVSIEDAVSKVSAGLVVPYPPGIPLLVPAQEITQAHIDYLKSLVKKEVEVHGLFDSRELYVKL
ncbi:MAG: aminotransferase class I/II-fold pyridoxal phosphate-dependent enzyme [Bacteroidota bacterium]